MQRRCFLKNCGCCLLAAATAPMCALLADQPALAARYQRGLLGVRPSPWFSRLEGKTVQCGLCPRQCVVEAGERGYCEVRENRDGVLHTLVYGNPCAVNVDPIEKKPFYHVLPTTQSFSIATAGCNVDCAFCQNFEISQARPENTLNFDLPPEDVAAFALRNGCRSIASTYVEPVIFMEYLLDVGRRAKEAGVLNVVHSNGFVNPAPLDALCEVLDAASIDLKGFTEEYYREIVRGELKPVLGTLETMRRRGVFLELVTLVVPGKNDGMAEIAAMSRWVRDHLGAETPLHFSRFYPMYKLDNLPPTPVKTLEQARETALEQGLAYVYIGNVAGHEAQSTRCPGCGAMLVRRDGYRVRVEALEEGVCTQCGRAIPGIWRQGGAGA